VSLFKTNTLCPRNSGKTYATCCEPHHQGIAAPSAEALMRSRYTAYVFKLEDYLLASWHPSTRPSTLDLSNDPPMKWLGLEVKHAKNTGPNTAIVEFIARYKIAGKAERLHEISEFVLENNLWYYVDARP